MTASDSTRQSRNSRKFTRFKVIRTKLGVQVDLGRLEERARADLMKFNEARVRGPAPGPGQRF